MKRLKRLKRLEGASGSFGPVEKERLGLPRPLVLHPLGLPQPLTQPLIWQLWPVSKSSRGLQDLAGASGSFEPVEPLVWQQQQQFGTRKGTTWLSLAAPIAGLARFEGFEGFERFEGFEAFEAFEAFGGSIRRFRASRKRKTWLATAASFAPTWLATASNLAALARFEEFEGFAGFGGSIREFRASRTATLAATATVWHKKRNHLA